MEQLGALWVRRVFEDGAVLRPGGEGALGGVGEAEGWEGDVANGGGECCCVGAVGGCDESCWCCGAADPARILREEGVEPGGAVLL